MTTNNTSSTPPVGYLTEELKRIECSCEECRELCLGNPGWFVPGEATIAAKVLGLTLQEFFDQYLVVEYWAGLERGNVYVLAPARTTQTPGDVAGWNDNFKRGRCRLLGDNGCILSLEHRPFECAVCNHNSTVSLREQVKEAWKLKYKELLVAGMNNDVWYPPELLQPEVSHTMLAVGQDLHRRFAQMLESMEAAGCGTHD